MLIIAWRILPLAITAVKTAVETCWLNASEVARATAVILTPLVWRTGIWKAAACHGWWKFWKNDGSKSQTLARYSFHLKPQNTKFNFQQKSKRKLYRMKILLLLIHWLAGGYLIRFDQILGPHGGDFDQKFFWKVKCPTYARGPLPPIGLNIYRCKIWPITNLAKLTQERKQKGKVNEYIKYFFKSLEMKESF